MSQFVIRPLSAADRDWLNQILRDAFGDERVVVHKVIYYPADLPGFVAEMGGMQAGVVTYTLDFESCEIFSLNSVIEGQGIGTLLIEAVRGEALKTGCQRLWLVTTNDNLHALGFCQRRGFRLADLWPGAVDEARKIKPAIPLIGANHIPIHDKIELEIHL
jgi:GNAT superfamily N-acetyltransferase